MPRHPAESDPPTWKAFGHRLGLDTTRRRLSGAVDRRCSDNYTIVADVLLEGPAGEQLANRIADTLNQTRTPASLLRDLRRARGRVSPQRR